MWLKKASLIAVLGLWIAPAALAADSTPSSASPQTNVAIDSAMILPTSSEPWLNKRPGEDRFCLSMRTYKVRKNMDRGSVIPANPKEAAFDPNDIIGYSTCQPAGKFAVKTTE
jgi:hypothetical protein